MIEDSSRVEMTLYPEGDFLLVMHEEVIPEDNVSDRECVYTWSALMDHTEVLWARDEIS